MKKKEKKIENHDDRRADIMDLGSHWPDQDQHGSHSSVRPKMDGGNYDIREAEAKLQTSLKKQQQRNYSRESY